ncbi:twin-arginine translocation signal domain-containing protein [Sphingobacterium sp. E70]|nr:twin-arginine translocation signal domain-containing protein [Sphingobacterium sp. E70]ULT24746.1 twin-arginine translocation signal domain-containing protein [Sphingobacterium sp. E70]
MEELKSINRRTFIKQAGGFSAALALGSLPFQAAAKVKRSN